ncbi:uncharacterized protein [Lolium perenne]|uniref:uncharacterized protein n=1 Tax=Lolium perenne TaxID=4522 RepID=UPI0021F513B6|nr:uncharacterized protein LOC127331380 [Lolium perenne]
MASSRRRCRATAGATTKGSLLEEFLMQPERGLECVGVGGGGSYYAGTVDETHALGAQIPSERIEAGAGQEMAAITEVKSSVSMDVEKSKEVSGKNNMSASK